MNVRFVFGDFNTEYLYSADGPVVIDTSSHTTIIPRKGEELKLSMFIAKGGVEISLDEDSGE